MLAEVEIQQVGSRGQGVGSDVGGNIYFVPGAVPGDRVEVDYGEASRRYRDAKLLKVLRPASDRIEVACPYFGRCGGCDWLQWDYSSQLQAKEAMLRHILGRGGFQPKSFRPFFAAKKVFGYRSRIQLRQDGHRVGFFKKRTHEVIDVENCLVADEKLNEELSRIRLEPPSPLPRKIELELKEDGTVGRYYDVPHGHEGFTQIHEAQNHLLRKQVADWVSERQSRSVLELFCGDGNLTFAYLPAVESCLAFDGNPKAISRACELRDAQGYSHGAFFCQSVDGPLAKSLERGKGNGYDTLILDPPRRGVGKCLKYFIHSNLKTVIFCSCAPISFTWDAQGLKEEGFSLDCVQGIDMFPHTRHLEFVALFTRLPA